MSIKRISKRDQFEIEKYGKVLTAQERQTQKNWEWGLKKQAKAIERAYWKNIGQPLP